jgi:azurin
MNWGSDGSMFVGMTARGWSATGTDDYGLQRLEWTGKIPFEIKSIKARPDGFELEFTKPVDVRSAKNSKSYDLATFTYQYHHNYGSPVINNSKRSLKAISVSSDKLKVRLVLDSLKEGYIHQIKADGILSSDDSRLLHDVGYYTLNQLPEGEKLAITAENRVSAPVAHVHTAKAKEAPKVAVKSTSKHLTTQPQGWTEGPDKAFVLGTKPGLKFDTELLTVKAGDKVKITFKNDDDMLHNFVITTPGSGVIVGELAGKLGLNGEKLNYVPNSPAVLFYTRLLQPNESDTIYFTAPSKPGDYTFECTYPGHYLVMKGIFKVTQ